MPELVNLEWRVSEPVVNTLLEEANLKLGALDAFSAIVPDVELFINMHVAKEAVNSSKIEGTQTQIEEIVQKERNMLPEKKDDWNEVQNYIQALNFAIDELEKLPLSSRLFTATHNVLLSSVRGRHRMPGEYRKSQNWIGGSSLKDVVFIPPPHESINGLMGDLENFLNNENIDVPHLIRIAISHYQFETIHPFLDGNGRIGRLLIPLYLISQGLLAKPALYMSDFFDRNRANYFDSLMRVRLGGDLTQWVKFLLVGMAETARRGRDVFKQILELRADVDHRVLELGRRATTGKQALNFLYSNPVVNAVQLAQALGVSEPTANALI